MEEKKYGLIRLSKTDRPKTTLKKNIFDSDSDEETQNKSNKMSTSSGIRRQTKLDISRALTEDPNVFEYDSIYEDMKSQNESVVAIDSEAKEKPKPKYINSLLKFSENRKKENERRVERKIQKERQMEGNQFDDREQFVTNAYKDKLNEMKLEDERERRQEAIEELLDVKKQKDLSGFYRHLFNDDISSQKIDSIPKTADPPKGVSEEVSKEILKTIPKPKTNRQIRKRRNSSEESSDESPQRQVKVEKKDESKETTDTKDRESDTESEDNESNYEKPLNNSLDSNQEINSDLKEEKEVENKDPQKEESNKIPKLNKRELLLKIFTKRTVGDIFTEAQMRYFQRKDNNVIL